MFKAFLYIVSIFLTKATSKRSVLYCLNIGDCGVGLNLRDTGFLKVIWCFENWGEGMGGI